MKPFSGYVSQNFANEGRKITAKGLFSKMLLGFRLFFYLGCITSIALVVLIGTVSYQALNRQQVLEKWVEHSYGVLIKIDLANAYFKQVLLQADTSSPVSAIGLDKYEYKNLLLQLNSLKMLVSDNKRQIQEIVLLQHQIDELRRLSGKDSSRFSEQVALISATMVRFGHDQGQLLAKRRQAYSQSGTQTQIIVLAGSLLILVIVSGLIYVILAELKNRSRAFQQEHELNQLKSSFITLASHEFRTPLSSVLLSATLIEKYLVRDEKQLVIKHTAKIKQVVHNLEGILEDFLSLEKLEEGLVKAEFTAFDLTALCQEVIAALKIMAKPCQQLIYILPPEPQIVVLDRTLIEKSLYGLLTNAIKYAGDDVSIWLTTEVSDNHVMISVKDNGVGIAEEDQERLSTMFYRVHDTGHIAGTGLGLNIVKRYVKLMNGTFRFSSVPHEQTCFIITFPTDN